MNIRLRQNPDNEKQHVSRHTINSDCDCIHFNRWVLAYSALTKYKIGLKEATNTLFLQETKKRAKMKGRKGSETKALIRKTAFQQFLSKDYSTVPLKDIEACLHLTRGCMSYHYPSKQELFIDVIDYYVLHKQNSKNKNIPDDITLWDFINGYIKKVQEIKEEMTQFLLVNSRTNITRAYMNLILQAEMYYPQFNDYMDEISLRELRRWESILTQAKEREEIKSTCNIRLLAQLFRNLFIGKSYQDALTCGLKIEELRELFYYQYRLIKK